MTIKRIINTKIQDHYHPAFKKLPSRHFITPNNYSLFLINNQHQSRTINTKNHNPDHPAIKKNPVLTPPQTSLHPHSKTPTYHLH